jgi:hypothetical protein
METPEPNWREAVESPADQGRGRLRKQFRKKRKLFFLGIVSLLFGALTVAFGLLLGWPLVYWPGIVACVIGVVLMLAGGVIRYRAVGTFGSMRVVAQTFGPPESDTERLLRDHKRAAVETWLGQSAEAPSRLVRCRACDAVSSEDARFCKRCGSALR